MQRLHAVTARSSVKPGVLIAHEIAFPKRVRGKEKKRKKREPRRTAGHYGECFESETPFLYNAVHAARRLCKTVRSPAKRVKVDKK
jgi:hypothetical protein